MPLSKQKESVLDVRKSIIATVLSLSSHSFKFLLGLKCTLICFLSANFEVHLLCSTAALVSVLD